jgi:hypothetical protein
VKNITAYIKVILDVRNSEMYRMGREDVTYFTSLPWATGWSGESECCSCTYVLVCSLVVMDKWTVNYRVFAVRTCFQTKSIVQTQIRSRHEFDVPRHGRIPSCNAILKWVDDFNVRGSVVNKFVGPAHSVRTPQDVERVTATMQQSPTSSARRHAIALQMSSRSLRRILHED